MRFLALIAITLVGPAMASAPDDGARIGGPIASPVWTPTQTAEAKRANEINPFLNAAHFVHASVCKLLRCNRESRTILALGLVSQKMADRILRIHPNEAAAVANHETTNQAIRIQLQDALRAHPDQANLDPWKGYLFTNTSRILHLIWASQMLEPRNSKLLWGRAVFLRLSHSLNIAALCLGAHAAEIFTEQMSDADRDWIIEAALESSRFASCLPHRIVACKQHFFTNEMLGMTQAFLIRTVIQSSRAASDFPSIGDACKQICMGKIRGLEQAKIIATAIDAYITASEIVERGAACKQHFFTKEMDAQAQSMLIQAVFRSRCDVSDFAQIGVACQAFCMEGMNGWDQSRAITAALPLSIDKIQQLATESNARLWKHPWERAAFIEERALQLGRS